MTRPTVRTPPSAAVRRRRTVPAWARIFLAGLAMWSATVVITFLTGNPNLVPTLILIGSFLVPITFVGYALARTDEVITAQRVFSAFVYGGVLGVLGASLLEAVFLTRPSGAAYLGIGLTEEGVKLAALWLLARRLPRYTMRGGIVLGAAVGFGFAAFESAGYAFTSLFTRTGLSLPSLVETEVLRGVLTPVGHGLWTAVLGGALFAAAARRGRPRLTGAVLGWYALMALLHACWDASPRVAEWLTLQLTGTQEQWLGILLGHQAALSPAQVHLVTALTWGLQGLDALAGILILHGRWRRATRAYGPRPLPAAPVALVPPATRLTPAAPAGSHAPPSPRPVLWAGPQRGEIR